MFPVDRPGAFHTERVYYVIDSLGAGGAERSLAELLPVFLQQGLDISIICLKRLEVGFEADVRSHGGKLRFLSDGPRWRKVFELRRMLLMEQVDLVHTTLFEANLIGRLAAVGTGIPVLTSLVDTAYDRVHLRDPNVRRSRLRAVQLVDAYCARLMTTHFHAITGAVKDSAVRNLGIREQRITVIERGRSRSRLGDPGVERRLEARRRLGLCPDAEVLLSVGRQEYRKGQRYLLEAVEPLMRSYPRLVLLMAGRPGQMTEQLSALAAELGIDRRVWFLGHRTDVPDLLAAADLFVFPSLSEGLGGAVLEAMAMGVPIVASDLPALREVMEDGRCGLLVEPASPPALTAAIARLLEDDAAREQLGTSGRAMFNDRFTIERSAERMLELYHALASPRHVTAEPGLVSG